MAEGGVNDLLVEIRASADKYSADLKKIRTESNVLFNSLKSIGDPLKSFGDEAKRAGESTSRAMEEARNSVELLSQSIGLHLPRSLTRFIAETKGLAPVLAGAFSGFAIAGLISQLNQLPAIFDKLAGSITGWDEAAKKAYDHFLDENKKAVEASLDLLKAQNELANRKNPVAAITGDLKIMETALLKDQQELVRVGTAIEELKNKQRLFGIGGLGFNELLSAGLRKIDDGGLKDLEATFKRLQESTAAYAAEINKLRGVAVPQAVAAAYDEAVKGGAALLALNIAYTKSWNDLLQTIRTGGMASGADDIAAGLKASDAAAKQIIDDYKEIRKLQLELINMNKDYLEFWDKKLQDIRTSGTVSGGDDIKAGLDAADRTAKKIIENAEKVKKAGQAIIDQLIGDISRLFTGMIANGQTFWEAFKNLGQAAIGAIADVFLSKMLHNALDPLAAKIGGMLSNARKADPDFVGPLKDQSKFNLGSLVKGGAIAAAATAAVIGIEKVGSAIVGMFGKLRREADKFVGEKQNPFAETVANLFKGLTDAQAIGSLTVEEVKRARISFEQLWKDFQSQAAAAGVVGQQALATMTPFLASWRSWLDGLDLAASSLEHVAKVLSFTSKVTDAAKDSEALNEAISNLQQNGASAASIIEFLGGDIESMVAAMKALNMEIPAGISGINDLMNAITRIGEIDTELQNISEQLSSAITNKLDILDNEINQLSETLNDAAHWQKVYDDAVKESADNFKRLTDERASIEKRIASLTQDVERDKLVAALKNAKASDAITDTLVKTFKGITKGGHAFTAVATTIKTLGGSTAGVTAAQKELDDFDAAIREKEMESRRNELAELQNRLPLVIQQQHEAEAAYANASAAAQEAILTQKEYIRTRLEELRKDKDATEALAKALGIARKTEWENINDTITGLETRATKLLEERDALKLLFPAATDATQAINDMIAALRAGLTTPASAIEAPLPQPQSPAAALAEMPHTISELASLNWGFGIPSFDIGGVARHSGMAQVEAGELMIPKGQVGQMLGLLREIASGIRSGHVIEMDSTKVGKVQNRATQYGSTRSLASEVRR